MAEGTLEFGNGSWDEAKGTIFTTLRAHDKTLYGGPSEIGHTKEISEIHTQLAVIKGYGQASAFWGRLTAGVVAIGLTAIGLILAFKGH